MRRTTHRLYVVPLGQRISIHVLRAEDDSIGGMSFAQWLNFNPRPPCGGRQTLCKLLVGFVGFQSTSSVRRTTQPFSHASYPIDISIHVLRAEDDAVPAFKSLNSLHFNPRPPCGGRLLAATHGAFHAQFQSTSSVRRTTGRFQCPACP